MATTQEIYVLNKRLKLTHNVGAFKTSIDSVLLAAACPVKEGAHLLDLGCGVGGAGLCVLRRVAGVQLTGVEIQAEHVALARSNAAANGLVDQCTFIGSDIRDYKNDNAFDYVICNPPYLEEGKHLKSPSVENAIAMGGEVRVKDWIDCAYDCLKSNGTLTMIHRADNIDKIILGLGKRFGAVEIIPLWPKGGVPAKRVILRAIKHRKSPAHIHAGLVLHDAKGEYTEAVQKILRDAEALM